MLPLLTVPTPSTMGLLRRGKKPTIFPKKSVRRFSFRLEEEEAFSDKNGATAVPLSYRSALHDYPSTTVHTIILTSGRLSKLDCSTTKMVRLAIPNDASSETSRRDHSNADLFLATTYSKLWRHRPWKSAQVCVCDTRRPIRHPDKHLHNVLPAHVTKS